VIESLLEQKLDVIVIQTTPHHSHISQNTKLMGDSRLADLEKAGNVTHEEFFQ